MQAASSESGFSLAEILRMMRERASRLPFEIGGYVALEVCEDLVSSPRVVIPESVFVDGEGGVSVDARPPEIAGLAPEASLRALLAELLVVAGSEVPDAMLHLVEAGDTDGEEIRSLSAIRDDLEAALLPLNREASRRVLGRFLRELRRGKRGFSLDSFESEEVDADLDDFLGMAPGERIHREHARGNESTDDSRVDPNKSEDGGLLSAGEDTERIPRRGHAGMRELDRVQERSSSALWYWVLALLFFSGLGYWLFRAGLIPL